MKYYLELRGFVLPARCRPRVRTPEPRNVPGARFDVKRVDRVIRALRALRHTQGKWAGRPLEPDAWQVAFVIAPTFGWVHRNEDGVWVRIIRTLFVEVPRKNGKTTLIAALLLYLAFADGEPGAQVLAGAASKTQARFAFDPARAVAKGTPQLREVGVRALTDRILQDGTTNYVQVVSSVGDLQQGANPHAACLDELHVHKTSGLIDAIESGTGARDQPLVIIITTASDGSPETPYAHKVARIEALAKRTVKDPTTFGVIFGARPSDNPFAEDTWYAANPGLGVSPTLAFMRAEAAKAESSPHDLAKFLRLNLGVRTRQRRKFITLATWDRNAGIVERDKLEGRAATGGLDLASVSDLNALAWVLPDGDDGFDVLYRFWTPEENVIELDKRTDGAASVWVRQGLLVATPGSVSDYDYIRAQVVADCEWLDVRSLGYDPYNATGLVTDLLGEGVPMVKVRQSFAGLSAATKEFQRVLLSGNAQRPLLRHGGHPVMRWMVNNLAVSEDANGNVKPDKKAAAEKIDGVTATVIALAEHLNGPLAVRSAYEHEGLAVV